MSKRFSPEVLIFLVVLSVCSLIYKVDSDARNPKPVPETPATPRASIVSGSAVEGVVESDVQVALILDTSASMDGLILQAREQILDIVTELQNEGEKGPRTVSLALYQYGTNQASESEGFIQFLAPLSLDHERIVEVLHGVRAGGSKEYAPLAIKRAVEELAWNPSTEVPKVIVIVGNEAFGEGPESTESALSVAQAKGIKVLPIYCVGEQASISALSGWRRAAYKAGTSLEMIDPNQVLDALQEPMKKPVVVEQTQTHHDNVVLRPTMKLNHSNHKPVGYPAASQAPANYESSVPTSRKVGDFGSGMRRGLKGVLNTY